MHFNDMGIADKLVKFSNGKEVVDFIEAKIDEIDINRSGARLPLLPVALLLLDINMPVMNGLDASKIIQDKFNYVNEKLRV